MLISLVFGIFAMLWGGLMLALGLAFNPGSYDFSRPLTFGGPPAAGSAAKSSSSVAGLGLVDSVAREVDLTAVDTWTAIVNVGASTEGNIQVPVGGNYLSLIDVAVDWDMDNTPIGGLAGLVGIRLTGNAIRRGGTHQYLVAGASIGGHTSGGAGGRSNKVSLPMKVEMQPSNTLKIEGIMMGEDVGAATVRVAVTFTNTARQGGIEDGDFRESEATAVDTWTALTTLGATTEGNFKVPVGFANLAAVGIVATIDPGDLAASVRGGVMARLTGNGLASGGTFTFLNDGLTLNIVTTGMAACFDDVDQQAVDLAVKPGNEIKAEVIITGEDPGSMSAGVQLFWGE
jgi:hypothetical protein